MLSRRRLPASAIASLFGEAMADRFYAATATEPGLAGAPELALPDMDRLACHFRMKRVAADLWITSFTSHLGGTAWYPLPYDCGDLRASLWRRTAMQAPHLKRSMTTPCHGTVWGDVPMRSPAPVARTLPSSLATA